VPNQARILRATGGMDRNMALTAHQFAFGSPVLFRLIPTIAAAKALRTLIKAIRTARSPRVAHPRTSTGVEATRKKRAGRIAGTNTCKIIGLILKPQGFMTIRKRF
jgi:hypothetical protein